MKTNLSIEDQRLFALEMSDVQPIKNSGKVTDTITREATPGLLYRREAAQFSEQEKHGMLSLVLRKRLTANDWLSFKRDGVQNGVFKNLRTGKYALEATLNLNGKTPDHARNDLQAFIEESQECNIRCLLLTYGRGGSGILIKSYLAQWLPELDAVQAFHTALKHHGGNKAVYVLLKKSEAEKAHNRERHAARLAE